MTWQEITVIGTSTRSAVEHASRTPDAHVQLELPDDLLPPHTYDIYGMWFIELSITGLETTRDTDQIDGADEPMTSVSFTGVITGADIPIKVIFFGETLDRFMADLPS